MWQQQIQRAAQKGFHLERIFDFSAMRQHRERAAGRLAGAGVLLQELGERLLDRLDDTDRKFGAALDFGGRGVIAPALAARGMAVASADFSPNMAAIAGGTPLVLAGEDFGLKAQTYDLVVAHFSLHWLDDLPGALIQLRRALKPEGLFLASMPVLGTLAELRTALLEAEEICTGGVSPRISPFPDLRDCAGLLQRAGFALPVADADEIALLYADPFTLLQDLRDAGETNAVLARSKKFAPQNMFPMALAGLPEQDGRRRVTLRMAVLTGWAS